MKLRSPKNQEVELLARTLLLLVALAAQAAPTPSPYLAETVDVGVSHWFQRVTFKDVGLAAGAGERETWIRAVTHALARALDTRLMARAHAVAEVAAPEWHHACQGRHVYVDVWRGTEPARVGFSLWRGCGAEDEFAWQEVPVDGAWVSSAQDVAGAIAHVLEVCGEAPC